MKRWLLFGYDQYYPGGGWTDFLQSYDMYDEAVDAIARRVHGNFDYHQVVDTTDGSAQQFGGGI